MLSLLNSNLDNSDISLFLHLYKNNSKAASELLSVMSQDKAGSQIIISMLGEKNKDGKTILQHILESENKESVASIIAIILKVMESETHFSQNQSILAAAALFMGGLLLANYAGDTSALAKFSGHFMSFSGVLKHVEDYSNFNRLKNNYLGLNSGLKFKPDSTGDVFNTGVQSAQTQDSITGRISRLAYYLLTQSKQEVMLKNTHNEIYSKLKYVATLFAQKQSLQRDNQTVDATLPVNK